MDKNLTMDDIKNYLKDNLSIEVEEHQGLYGHPDSREVKLLLEDEVIAWDCLD